MAPTSSPSPLSIIASVEASGTGTIYSPFDGLIRREGKQLPQPAGARTLAPPQACLPQPFVTRLRAAKPSPARPASNIA